MSNAVNLASLGLGSGLNDAQLITSLVSVMQAPLTSMQTTQSLEQSASSTISGFSATLSGLQSAADALSDATQYASYTATSSSSAVVANASSSATPGTYSVQVQQLAQTQVTYSNPQSSSTAALGMSGTLGITIGGNTVNVPISSGDSLASIATNIASSGAGVSASVAFDGSQYRLQIQGLSSGAANAISFTETGVSFGLPDAANTYQPAQDAKATINNIPVTSSSNQLSGAIPGVTLALTSTMATAGTVTVASNTSTIATKISSFVTAYNAMVTAGHTDTGYGATPATNALLEGNSAIKSALSQVSSLIVSNVPGADASYPNLASVGVTFNNDGSLSLNQATLNSALQADPSGVEKLFVTDPSNGSTGVMGTLNTAINSLVATSGGLYSETKVFNGQVQTEIKNEAALAARVTQYQNQLEAEFTTMEQNVQNDKSLFSALGGTGTFV